jgi:hypothetical protein
MKVSRKSPTIDYWSLFMQLPKLIMVHSSLIMDRPSVFMVSLLLKICINNLV